MKEVDYNNKKYEILDEGDYNGRHYVITYTGSHPCAYVEFHDEFESGSKLWENVPCNWGANFLNRGPWTYHYNINDDPRIYIGWDYGHLEDYSRYNNDTDTKKWTVKEIREDVKKVVDYLNIFKTKSLLTTEEKTYLENVLKSYKSRIIYIKKQTIGRNWAGINIKLESIIAEKLYDMISLPVFEKDKYYKNLVNNQPYTKEDLELFEKKKYKITLTEFWNSKYKLAHIKNLFELVYNEINEYLEENS